MRGLSRPARLVAWGAVLLPRSAPVGWLVLSVCLLAASVLAGRGVAVGMAVRGCLPFRPRGSCGLPLRVRLSVGPTALVARLVVCLVAPCACLAACDSMGVSCLRFAFPRYEYRPVPLVVMPRCGSRRLIISSARLSLGGLLPPHRIIGSPPASYRPAPRPIRQAGRGGNGLAAGCLLVPGMAMGWIGSCVSLFLSSSHPIDEATVTAHHLIISSTGRGLLFLFA